MNQPVITFELGLDEALVVYELVESLANDPAREQAIRKVLTAAELLALYRVDGAIERTLPELFSAEYPEMLRAARERLEIASQR